MAQRRIVWLFLMTGLSLIGCASVDTAPVPSLSSRDHWVVLPLENLTDTPMAGQRAAALLAAGLSARGFTSVASYQTAAGDETLFEPASSDQRAKALAWARSEQAPYALTGSVIEWRYKVGIDGEPVVGLALQLIEVDSGKVVWRASGSRSGWSMDSVAGVATSLSDKLLAPLLAALSRRP